MDSSGGRFVRRENVKHYLDLLEQATDDKQIRQIQKLLGEEVQKQVEADDAALYP
jgi:hypothetical protein